MFQEQRPCRCHTEAQSSKNNARPGRQANDKAGRSHGRAGRLKLADASRPKRPAASSQAPAATRLEKFSAPSGPARSRHAQADRIQSIDPAAGSRPVKKIANKSPRPALLTASMPAAGWPLLKFNKASQSVRHC